MVDPRRSLPDVCVAVLTARFAAVDGIGVPCCFVTPIIKPFGQIVFNILEHASVRWFAIGVEKPEISSSPCPLFLLSCQIAALSGFGVPR